MRDSTDLVVRKGKASDVKGLCELYRDVAKIRGGIARTHGEITEGYIQHILETALKRGLIIVAQEKGKSGKLRGAIHAYRPNPKAFSHLLSSLTIVVHPETQGLGVGRQIFSYFLDTVKSSFPDILRVELFVRESNLRGILLYETLGFVREGRMENRIQRIGGGFEADIYMAWFNPKYKDGARTSKKKQSSRTGG